MTSPDKILELTHLNVANHIPSSHSSILQNLQEARTLLADKVHPTRSRFYQDLQAPEKIFILGTWPSVKKHQEFLANTELKTDVLGGQEGLLSFGWSAHVSLSPPLIAKGGIGQAIISTKAVGIQRIRIAAENVERFQNLLGEDFRYSLQRISGNETLLTWNLDYGEKEVREYIIITVWPSGIDEDREKDYRQCFQELGKEYGEIAIDADLRFTKDMEGSKEEQEDLPVA